MSRFPRRVWKTSPRFVDKGPGGIPVIICCKSKKMKGEAGESVKVIFESPVHTVLDMSVIEEGCKQALTLSGYVSFF